MDRLCVSSPPPPQSPPSPPPQRRTDATRFGSHVKLPSLFLFLFPPPSHSLHLSRSVSRRSNVSGGSQLCESVRPVSRDDNSYARIAEAAWRPVRSVIQLESIRKKAVGRGESEEREAECSRADKRGKRGPREGKRAIVRRRSFFSFRFLFFLLLPLFLSLALSLSPPSSLFFRLRGKRIHRYQSIATEPLSISIDLTS